MYPLFRRRRRPCPVRGRFVRDGSAPPALPQLSLTIGPSGEPLNDNDNDDPTGEPRLPEVHHGIFVMLVIPTCLRHRVHRCCPPKMTLSKLV